MSWLAILPLLALSAAPEPSLKLTLQSDSPNVELIRVSSDGIVTTTYGAATIHRFERVCMAPCEEEVTGLKSDFFFGGKGVATSSVFSLMGRRGDLTMKVEAGSSGLRGLGVALTWLGGVALACGGVFLGTEALLDSSSGTSLGKIGRYTAIGGAVALAGGIPLIVFNGTSFEFLPAPRAAAPISTEATP
jgi:hypothetical protein